MTGLISAVLTGFGITLVLFGTVAGLAIADFPAAVAVTTGLGLSGACLYACHRWRSRRHGPWFPSLRGRSVRLSVLAAVWAALTVLTALRGMLGATAVFGTGAVLTALWSGMPGRTVPGREECPEWTDEDEVILGGDLAMTAWKRAGQAGRDEAR